MTSGSRLTQLRDEAIAAAEALRRSQSGVVEVLRSLQSRREHEGDADALRRLEDQLRALIEVAAAAAAAHSLGEVLEFAADQALAATGGASLSISRWCPDAGKIQTLINAGDLAPGEERLPESEIYDASDFPEWIDLFEGVPQINAVDDPASDPGQRALLARLGRESSIGVAIRFRGQVWGELWATTNPGMPRFARDDVIFLQAISEQIGAAIGRAELFDQLAQLAYRDPLTGVANRRALDESLARAFISPREDVTLLMCDVDGLKAANDELGHEAGDAILIRAGAALCAAAAEHPGAMVSRIGGDEFCVLLPTGGLDAARALALDVTGRLRAEPPPITMSCGAACSLNATPAELLRAADAAQYEAKHLGFGVFRAASEGVQALEPDKPRPRRRRRSYRDRDVRDLAAMLHEILALLDEELSRASVAERLYAVAGRIAEACDACAFGVGLVPPGSEALHTVRCSDGAELPLRAALCASPGTFVLCPTEPPEESSDLERLRARGFASALSVVTPGEAGTWLTTLFSTDGAFQLRGLSAELRLLALAAVAGSGSASL
jgi:diguanylate cyclase (GGDEF)-like protein